MFPQAEPGTLERPTFPVGILLGCDVAEFMTFGGALEDGERIDGLMCLRAPIGPGRVLSGRHESIKALPCPIDPEVNTIRSAVLCYDSLYCLISFSFFPFSALSP